MTRLSRVLERLRSISGKPKEPPSDPFALILLENVAYLADDARRDEAFRILTEATALSPERILAAPAPLLREAARRGILPDDRVDRLREIAAIALDEFGGDLDAVVRRPPKEAMKALRRFPSIGEPGAEKILLFAGRLAVLAPACASCSGWDSGRRRRAIPRRTDPPRAPRRRNSPPTAVPWSKRISCCGGTAKTSAGGRRRCASAVPSPDSASTSARP